VGFKLSGALSGMVLLALASHALAADHCQPSVTPKGSCKIEVTVGMAKFFYLKPGEKLQGPLAIGDANSSCDDGPKAWMVENVTSGTGEDKNTAIIIRAAEGGLTTNLLVSTDLGFREFVLKSIDATDNEPTVLGHVQ
jgi:type IV secretory pathway VirB9-like protein